jgi:NAD(P)-dependent dehydrogenase (short-subunit alcohol dehydrogenase family)
LAGAELIAAEIGGVAVHCDVVEEESAEKAFKMVEGKLGSARILVNCAGIAPAKRIVGRDGVMPLGDFRRAIEVNLIGTFNMLRLFAAQAMDLPPLADGERAIAICTSSIAADEGQIGQTAYAASKAGVAGLILPAARELSSAGIRVSGIAPGTFETPMLAAMPDAVRAALAAEIPFPKRLGQADEYALLAAHIIENTMINGTVMRIDGALRMAAS